MTTVQHHDTHFHPFSESQYLFYFFFFFGCIFFCVNTANGTNAFLSGSHPSVTQHVQDKEVTHYSFTWNQTQYCNFYVLSNTPNLCYWQSINHPCTRYRCHSLPCIHAFIDTYIFQTFLCTDLPFHTNTGSWDLTIALVYFLLPSQSSQRLSIQLDDSVTLTYFTFGHNDQFVTLICEFLISTFTQSHSNVQQARLLVFIKDTQHYISIGQHFRWFSSTAN